MSLAELIRKKSSAKLATHEGENRLTVATAQEVKTTSYHWLLHFPDRNPIEVHFTPSASHGEVLFSYPSALAAEPIEPGQQQLGGALAGDQEAAILAWLAQIGEIDEATIANVLTKCQRDEDAREYFLGRPGSIVADDDRRFCTQCCNLHDDVCSIAFPGGLVSAIVGYRPVPGVLHRCAGYSPNASDTDQRTGRERWPGLTNDAKGAK